MAMVKGFKNFLKDTHEGVLNEYRYYIKPLFKKIVAQHKLTPISHASWQPYTRMVARTFNDLNQAILVAENIREIVTTDLPTDIYRSKSNNYNYMDEVWYGKHFGVNVYVAAIPNKSYQVIFVHTLLHTES